MRLLRKLLKWRVSILDYQDLYLIGDTLQLADVMQKFRKMMYDNHKLD